MNFSKCIGSVPPLLQDVQEIVARFKGRLDCEKVKLTGTFAATIFSLDDPNAIIISKSTAGSIFGNEDPISQTVRINASRDAIVTGVYDDMAPNSSFGHIEFFGNFEGLKNNTPALRETEMRWGNNAARIIVQTADNV